MDVKGAVEAAKGGAVEFRVEKAGIVHAGIGKASFDEAKLIENIRAFADAVSKAKPAGAKGTYIQRVAVSSTMGPGVKVDPSSVLAAERNTLEKGPVHAPGLFLLPLTLASACYIIKYAFLRAPCAFRRLRDSHSALDGSDSGIRPLLHSLRQDDDPRFRRGWPLPGMVALTPNKSISNVSDLLAKSGPAAHVWRPPIVPLRNAMEKPCNCRLAFRA